ncbi:phosphoribosylanthranilate isomerase [Bacteroides propionicifaciens]|uniref:phosphoribosylanthranilate isomerase n=1 Tax=Bacteroides propionicifaciens TaxID=392838 RepID=UPI00036CD360
MLKVKVCGMKYADNIEALSHLQVDYLGFICYPKSPRYIDLNNEVLAQNMSKINSSIQRVGVFVNTSLEDIKASVEQYHFDLVQLHGGESPSFCKQVQSFIPVIKAFSLESKEDLKSIADYERACSYFLFDTKTTAYGGSGRKFNWDLLEAYNGTTPFLLSGGIGIGDAYRIKELKHPLLLGVDLNSRFEIELGLKNINQLETFIKQLNDESN